MQKKRTLSLLVMMALAVFITNCAAAHHSIRQDYDNENDGEMMSIASIDEDAAQAELAEFLPQGGASKSKRAYRSRPMPKRSMALESNASPASNDDREPQPRKGRIMVYRANFTIALFDVPKAIEHTKQLINQYNGYLVSISLSSVTFRVPAQKFFEVVKKIESMGDVIDKNITGNDVTNRYRDLKIRLENLMKTRERLLALLDKVKDFKNILSIEREISSLTERIELIKGQLKALQEDVAFSRIQIYFREKQPNYVPVQKLTGPFRWINMLGIDILFKF